MTVDVPAGWHTEGEPQWRGDLDARLQVIATSPDDKVRVFLGDLDAMARQVPSQWTFMQTGAREGQTFDVPATHSRALVQHFMTGAEYAKYHATGRLCRDATFVAVTDDPEGSTAMTRAVAPEAARYGGTARVTAGTATFTCGPNQGEVYAATMLGSSRSGPIQGWIVFKVALR